MLLIITLQMVCRTLINVSLALYSVLQVTDELPAGPKRMVDAKSTMIQVQPLKRSEMQASLNRLKTAPSIYLPILFLKFNSLLMLRILELVKLPMEFMGPFCKDWAAS